MLMVSITAYYRDGRQEVISAPQSGRAEDEAEARGAVAFRVASGELFIRLQGEWVGLAGLARPDSQAREKPRRKGKKSRGKTAVRLPSLCQP